MARPFAWIAAAAAVVTFLCVLLPWHTIEVSHPVVAARGMPAGVLFTHSGAGCGLHGVWILVFAGCAALGAGTIALGFGGKLPISSCRVLIIAAILLAVAALLTIWDLFRDPGHCFEVEVGEIVKEGRENAFYIALLASVFGALSAGMGCLLRRGVRKSWEKACS